MDLKNCPQIDLFRTLFDAIPSLVFVVDEDVKIQEYNAAAADLLAVERSAVLKRRGGEALHCLHASDLPEGCGRAPLCRDCVIRNSVDEAFQKSRVVRRRAKLELMRDGNRMEIFALISASPFCYEERPLVLLVVEDIGDIAELRRMISICCVCKKVKNQEETWSRLESYFSENWDLEFSHGYCPECAKRLHEDLDLHDA